MKIILASSSPQRRRLMKEAGYQIKILPSHVRETYPSKFGPAQIVKYLALKKASDIAVKHKKAVVLGADTIVYFKGKVIGKPRNKKHAREILTSLSNNWQKVYTGVAVVWNGGKKKRVEYQVTAVKMKALSEKEMTLAFKNHMDKAGGYAIQEKNDPTVEKIKGDYDNVVGLPMKLVKRVLSLVV